MGLRFSIPEAGWCLEEKDVEEFPGQKWNFIKQSWIAEDDAAQVGITHAPLLRELSPRDVLAGIEQALMEDESTSWVFDYKVKEQAAEFRGYPAYATWYEDSEKAMMMVCIVVSRRALIFSAESLLSTFQQRTGLLDQIIESVELLPEDSPAPDPTPSLPRLFRGRGLGFTVNYPQGWQAERTDDKTVEIRGPENSELAGVRALFQSSGQGFEPQSVVAQIQQQIRESHPKAKISDVGDLVLAGGSLSGYQFYADFYQGWDAMRQVLGVLTDGNGAAFMILVEGPQEAIDGNRPVIEAMMSSLSPTR
jgi:hypothetical protein